MLVRTLAFVAPLGFDTFAVAVALGLYGMRPWVPAVVFAIFETTMPIAGILIGRFAGEYFAGFAEIAGGLILVGLAVHAFREARETEIESQRLDFQSLRAAGLAGLAISMDELAVGFPLGAARLPIGSVLLAIGFQAFLVSAGGIAIGSRLTETLGRTASRYAYAIAGSAFCGVGVWLIVEGFQHR